eukprot:Skav230842  [mRNA]  locus=scaffold3471:130509:135890:- [translate_table: standard]
MATLQLKDQDAKCPPIHCIGVAGGSNELRSEVVWSPATGKSLANHKLGQAHVCEFDVTTLCQEQILRFQVPVDDSSSVKMFKCVDHTGAVVPAMLLRAMETLPVVGSIQLAAQARLQEKVQGLRSIVSLPEFGDER